MPGSIGHVTSNDGTRIGFERSGDGSPLLLVHGTTADRTRWVYVLPAFEERFTVYAMDRRGRGLSGDTEPYALIREFEDVAAVVDSIGGPVDLLGHSYGALCALEAALLTQKVRRLVLYEPGFRTDEPLYPDGVKERLEGMLARGERAEAVTALFREVVGMSETELEAMRQTPVWQVRVSLAHTISREFADGDYVLDPRRFEAFATPTLLLTGGESPPAVRAPTDALHAALPTSRIEVMPGEHHMAMTTAPELFTRLVLDFLTA